MCVCEQMFLESCFPLFALPPKVDLVYVVLLLLVKEPFCLKVAY